MNELQSEIRTKSTLKSTRQLLYKERLLTLWDFHCMIKKSKPRFKTGFKTGYNILKLRTSILKWKWTFCNWIPHLKNWVPSFKNWV